MTTEAILQKLSEYQKQGKRMFVSSSFQTHSIPLLHLIAQSEAEVDVLFLNTGYHFPETLEFRDKIARLLSLKLTNLKSAVPKNLQRDAEGQLYFVSDPDYCCYLNKTQPLEPYLQQYDVWINGVRADQNMNRRNMKIEQPAPHGTTRFHPILDWNARDIYQYRKKHRLPEHPLDQKGYLSIGCEPCTKKFDASDERSARWFGMNKTECGLHTDLIENSEE